MKYFLCPFFDWIFGLFHTREKTLFNLLIAMDDVVIYNKKYMFGLYPISGTWISQNPRDFLGDQPPFVMLMRWLWKVHLRVGAGYLDNQPHN